MSQVAANAIADKFVSSQAENKSFIPVQHLQDEITFLREEVGNKNEIINTLLENINCFKKNNFLKIKIPLIILIKKVQNNKMKRMTPRTTVLSLNQQKKSKPNKNNIDKSNKIDNDIDFVTHNR